MHPVRARRSDVQHLAAAIAMLTHAVDDVDVWKASWDRHDDDRHHAGILAHHIHRAEDDPRVVTVLMPLADVARARSFAASPDRAAEMVRGGVAGPPEILWLEPLHDEVIRDRQLPACILRVRVADVGAWLGTVDASSARLSSMGIIGAAAYRSLDDAELVVVHHQAEAFDTLREVLADPGVGPLRTRAGVLAAPDVRFYTGGWARTYGRPGPVPSPRRASTEPTRTRSTP